MKRSHYRASVDIPLPTPLIAGLLERIPKGKLLDFGAGSGRNAIHAALRGWRVTAIDNNEHALTQLQYLAAALNVDKNINIINSDILTPIGDELFDFVVCNMVLHYASDESSAVEIVKNVQKATKIGGVNYFSTFTDSNMYGTRSCLLPDNRLAELYPDWLITDYDLRPSTTVINVDGREVNHFICSIVAFKIR